MHIFRIYNLCSEISQLLKCCLVLPEISSTEVETNGEKPMTSNGTVKVLGKLGEKERLDINCAVKEYLMVAGYKISAMTFQEEVLNRTWKFILYYKSQETFVFVSLRSINEVLQNCGISRVI